MDGPRSLAIDATLPARASGLRSALLGGASASHRGSWRDALLRRLVAAADLAAATLALLVVTGSLAERDKLLRAAVFLPACLVIAKVSGLYDRDQRALRHLTVDEAPRLLFAAVGATFALATVLVLTRGPPLKLGEGAMLALVTASLAFLLRAVARFVWRRATPPQRIAIVGDGPAGAAVRRKLELFDDIHAEVVHTQPRLSTQELRGDPAWFSDVERVIVVSSSVDDDVVRRLVAIGRRRRVKVSVVPSVAGMFGTAVTLNHVADLPVIEYHTWDVSRSTLFLKRCLDIVVSLTLLLLLLPLFAVTALLIKRGSPGPVLFRQQRAGLEGRPFWMLKFRTMVADAEELLPQLVSFEGLAEPVFKLENDPRTTPTGCWLRRWSVDELPQLLNVLRGEMSLVGPRPEQLELVALYSPEQRDRLRVKPGLTGPMQVYGRGRLSLAERLAVEREYIENLTIARDLRILTLTLPAVLDGRGAS
jgi:exopolysaccharide biosynthesis polyprenyl glycosylphosphotransferase